MSRFTPLLLAALLICLLPGCKSIITEQYIGEPIAAQDAQELQGVWKMEKDVIHVKLIENGMLVAAGVEWKNDKFEVNEIRLLITEHGDARFLFAVNVDDDDEHADDDGDDEGEGKDDDADNDEQEWLICGMVIRSDNDVFVLAGPKFDRFKEALEAGDIKGELEENGNTLEIESDKAALDALFTEDNLHEFFDMSKPMVITRIGDL